MKLFTAYREDGYREYRFIRARKTLLFVTCRQWEKNVPPSIDIAISFGVYDIVNFYFSFWRSSINIGIWSKL